LDQIAFDLPGTAAKEVSSTSYNYIGAFTRELLQLLRLDLLHLHNICSTIAVSQKLEATDATECNHYHAD
jgi:hypothetical protein